MTNYENELLVTIILPVYNAELYLKECIESIINQSYQNIEILVVDDASEDHSKTIIKEYIKTDNRFTLIEHSTNQGVSKSRNDALSYAHGEYIAFIDADDKVDKDFIAKLVDMADQNDLSICGYSKYDRESMRPFLLYQSEVDNYEKIIFHIVCSNYLGGYLVNKLFRRQLLKGLKFDEDIFIGEDLLFVIKYLEQCRSVAYISESLYYYRMNPVSAMHSVLSKNEIVQKKLTAIKAAERVQTLLLLKGDYINNCCSYRVAKTSLWMLMQMIFSRVYSREILSLIKTNIRKNRVGYRRLKYGGKFQYLVLLAVAMSPKMIWMVGILTDIIFHNKFIKN